MAKDQSLGYKKYLKFFNYGEQDYVPSEMSGLPAEHIHHIVFRSQSSVNPHAIKNLIAVTAQEHRSLHGIRNRDGLCALPEKGPQEMHDDFVLMFLLKNKHKINEMDDESVEYYADKFKNLT